MNKPFHSLQAAFMLVWLLPPPVFAQDGPALIPPLHRHDLRLEGEPENANEVQLVAGQEDQVTPLPQTNRPAAKPQADAPVKRPFQPVLPARRILPDYAYSTPRIDADYMPGHWMQPDPSCGAAGDALANEVFSATRFWAHFSYLSMWADGFFVPALVTTSPPGTPQAQAGVLPAATVLFGNEELDEGQRNGGRIHAGWWLVDGQFLAIEGDYWALETESTAFDVASSFSTDPNAVILARPFTRVGFGPDAAILAFPDFVRSGATVDIDGSVTIDTSSSIQSAGLNLRHILWMDFDRQFRLDVLGGYRFMQVDEGLQITDSFFDPGGGLLGPTLRQTTDVFDARNDFHGGELALAVEVFRNRWSVEVVGRLDLGNMHQTVDIAGQTVITTLGTVAAEPGGLLAQPTNIGHHRRDAFLAVPAGSVTLRYAVSANVELGLGFEIVYFGDVARPGDQIDTTINTSQIGGTLMGEPRPAHVFQSSDLLLRGISASVECRW
jgi:hypothetical protein